MSTLNDVLNTTKQFMWQRRHKFLLF